MSSHYSSWISNYSGAITSDWPAIGQDPIDVRRRNERHSGDRVWFRVTGPTGERTFWVETGEFDLSCVVPTAHPNKLVFVAKGNAVLMDCETLQSQWLPMYPVLDVHIIGSRNWLLLVGFCNLALIDERDVVGVSEHLADDDLTIEMWDEHNLTISGIYAGQPFRRQIPWHELKFR